MTDNALNYPSNSFGRTKILLILQSGIKNGEYRFVREAADKWLAAYPGDFEIQHLLATSMLLEGNARDAEKLLVSLIQVHPSQIVSYMLLASLPNQTSMDHEKILGCIHALGGEVEDYSSLPVWSTLLKEARSYLQSRMIEQSSEAIMPVIGLNLGLALVDLTHLQINLVIGEQDAVTSLIKLYHTRWPECAHFSMLYADSLLKSGSDIEGLALMNRCVTLDSFGRVAGQIWGQENPYRPLWPDRYEILLDIPIPAAVATDLGWNQIPAHITWGEKILETHAQFISEALDVTEHEDKSSPRVDSTDCSDLSDSQILSPVSELTSASDDEIALAGKSRNENKDFEILVQIEDVFARLAKTFKRPGVSEEDGRFPMYVVFSSHSALEDKYGSETFKILRGEMQKLCDSVSRMKGWGSVLFMPDDESIAAHWGIPQVEKSDPWKYKLALKDLDERLKEKGAMIGGLLIVGGPDIVPFHNLPNPTDDIDENVPSDNPYATTDSNYFVPEWQVGRLPDECGNDPGLLLEQLRRCIKNHEDGSGVKKVWWKKLVYPFDYILERLMQWISLFSRGGDMMSSIGYSAEIWQRSSIAVFRPIGLAQDLLVSPPEDSDDMKSKKLSEFSLSYYNLHGVDDGPEWYGQRDSTVSLTEVEYPVALKPGDIRKNGQGPLAVFSEACYGGLVKNKQIPEAISLKFISVGTKGIVGSTCIAYGSIRPPLIGADLLGYLFWKHVKEGYSLGESLLRSKVELVREMNKRQGYLDGEDQKTLLSFVLYGDPLASGEQVSKFAKISPRLKEIPKIPMVCDIETGECVPETISKQKIAEAKKYVEDYLPGLGDTMVHFSQQTRGGETVEDESDPQPGAKIKPDRSGNVVMTMSKQIQVARQVHRHYARVTLDSEGAMVKMAVSR